MTRPLAKLLLVDLFGAASALSSCASDGGKPCDKCIMDLRAAVTLVVDRIGEERDL